VGDWFGTSMVGDVREPYHSMPTEVL
jgi:hypothetical protein